MFAPETEVRFLSNVEIDVSYTNVRGFNSRQEETDYFIEKTKYYYPKCRTMDVYGYSGFVVAPIKDGMTIDSYYDCNYLMYKNSEISGKWFYALLGTPMAYSKSTCIIPYQVDLWRTWFMDCSIGECYVEREHVNDDTIGKWLKPEQVDVGEFVAVASDEEKLGYDLTGQLDNRNAIVIVNSYAPSVSGTDSLEIFDGSTGVAKWLIPGMIPNYVGGFLCGGLYQGAMFAAFPYDETTANTVVSLVNQYIKNIVTFGQADRIKGIFMCPFWVCQQVAGKLDIADIVNTNVPVSRKVTAKGTPTSFGSYVPKNNKLFTGQFNYFFIDNGAGGQESFQYEYFNRKESGELPFSIYGQLSESPSIRLVPDSYKCPPLSSGRDNNMYAFDLSGFPTGSYSYSEAANAWNSRVNERVVSYARDNYAMGKAKQDSLMNQVNAIQSATMSTASALTDVASMTSGVSGASGAAGAASKAVQASQTASGVSGILNSAFEIFKAGGQLAMANRPVDDEMLRIRANEAQYIDSQRIPNIIAGSANGSISYPLGYLTFTQYRMQVQEDYARRIDKYLSVFGYTVEEIKVPNLVGRRSWNYVKTLNATVNGNVPEEAKSFIANVLNTGIRIWHPGSVWLDYSQPNDIV